MRRRVQQLTITQYGSILALFPDFSLVAYNYSIDLQTRTCKTYSVYTLNSDAYKACSFCTCEFKSQYYIHYEERTVWE